MSGMWKRSTAKLVRHRQPKGPVTDRPSLKPPRHISTLQSADRSPSQFNGRYAQQYSGFLDAPRSGVENTLPRGGGIYRSTPLSEGPNGLTTNGLGLGKL